MCKALIDYYKDKKILILGFGREGQSTYNYIRRFLPEQKLAIADKNEIKIDDGNVTVHTGENYLESMAHYDIVMKTPGISLRGVEIPQGVEVTCQTDLFLRFAPCTKIGITGTKGKTTTSTLIYEVIAASGAKCSLIGNIGVPVFEALDSCKDSVAVIEMSSHQLEFSRSSPHIAVMTNLYPEHLDHYNGFEGYANAKYNIMKYQTRDDYLIYNPDSDELVKMLDLDSVKSHKIPVGLTAAENDGFLKSLTELNGRLLGEHNHQDICFAAQVAKILGIGNDSVKKGIENFKGIPHRLEPVGTFKGISFYNDSIATIPHAVKCGVEAIGNVNTLIFGGLDRGIGYDEFEDYLMTCPVENLIGLPETGHNIIDALLSKGCDKKTVKAADMSQAVEAAYELTEKGRSCLLSPAASSYNVYKNFEYKGNHFKELVKQLGKEEDN